MLYTLYTVHEITGLLKIQNNEYCMWSNIFKIFGMYRCRKNKCCTIKRKRSDVLVTLTFIYTIIYWYNCIFIKQFKWRNWFYIWLKNSTWKNQPKLFIFLRVTFFMINFGTLWKPKRHCKNSELLIFSINWQIRINCKYIIITLSTYKWRLSW